MSARVFVRLRRTVAAASACCAIVLHGTVAANVLFSGAGTWATDASFSSLSAPNASWSFLFVLPDTISGGTTTAISSFSYRLDGVSIAAPAAAIVFYSAQDGGMFDIAFGGSTPSLSLYGDAVLSGTALATGHYTVFAGVGGGQPVGTGNLSLTQVPVPVPEPATWTLLGMGLGLAGVAALVGGRRRSSQAVTVRAS